MARFADAKQKSGNLSLFDRVPPCTFPPLFFLRDEVTPDQRPEAGLFHSSPWNFVESADTLLMTRDVPNWHFGFLDVEGELKFLAKVYPESTVPPWIGRPPFSHLF